MFKKHLEICKSEIIAKPEMNTIMNANVNSRKMTRINTMKKRIHMKLSSLLFIIITIQIIMMMKINYVNGLSIRGVQNSPSSTISLNNNENEKHQSINSQQQKQSIENIKLNGENNADISENNVKGFQSFTDKINDDTMITTTRASSSSLSSTSLDDISKKENYLNVEVQKIYIKDILVDMIMLLY